MSESRDLDVIRSEIADLTQQAVDLAQEETSEGTDLVLAADAAGVKRKLAHRRASMVKVRRELDKRTAEMERVMQAEMEKANQVLGPLQEMVRKLEEGIWTVNLYLGRDEQIVTLREGEPASADTPITVRQLVLAMDQECAVNAETGGIDFRDFDQFDEWLLENEANVQQVIPEQKCVVALVPRYESKDMLDPWAQRTADKLNAQTYFLIRNGERLHRTATDFKVGKHLVATAEEFTSFFVDTHYDFGSRKDVRKPLVPGSDRWMAAEKRAEARTRHYMRAALILEGLLHRTPLFHPLPEEGVSFLDLAHHEAGRVVFVNDAEALLTDGREEFRDWLRRINGQMRVGTRIMGRFDSYNGTFAGYEYEGAWGVRPGNKRLKPGHARKPASNALHTLTGRSGGMFTFLYDREGEDRYDSYRREYVPLKTRATCSVHPDDDFVLAFDFAEVADMERFLVTRGSRPDYAEMFPLLKQAIKLKKEEAEAEVPFIEMLKGVVMRDGAGASYETVERLVPELVRWWKLKNRYHRALIGTEQEQQKAVTEIVAQFDVWAHEERDTDPKVLKQIKAAHPAPLLIGKRRSNGYWMVLEIARPGERAWVLESEYTKTGKRRSFREWKLWRPQMEEWRVVEMNEEEWPNWRRDTTLKDQFTDPEIDRVLRAIDPRKYAAVVYDPEKYVGSWVSGNDTPHLVAWKLGKKARLAPADKLLTGKDKYPQMKEMRFRLVRDDDGEVTWKKGIDRDSSQDSISRASDLRPWGGNEWTRKRRVRLLSTNEGEIARIDDEWERWTEYQEKREKLLWTADAYARTIEKAWVERAEAREYERFLEDYADPELWEGHKKGLERKLTFPYATGVWDGLRVAEHLVEKGISPAGMTFAEACDKAAEFGWKHREDGSNRFRDSGGWEEELADLGDLVYATPPPKEEPEDEDLDEDEDEETTFTIDFIGGAT